MAGNRPPGNFVRNGIAALTPGVVEVLRGGSTSLVGVLNDWNTFKYPVIAGEAAREFEDKVAIYEALGDHPRGVKFLVGLRMD
jgi:hypothetical protein